MAIHILPASQVAAIQGPTRFQNMQSKRRNIQTKRHRSNPSKQVTYTKKRQQAYDRHLAKKHGPAGTFRNPIITQFVTVNSQVRQIAKHIKQLFQRFQILLMVADHESGESYAILYILIAISTIIAGMAPKLSACGKLENHDTKTKQNNRSQGMGIGVDSRCFPWAMQLCRANN